MLNNTTGYDFYFAGMDREILFIFPITPPELNIKMGATNETVNLINDGNINILKSLDLTEIEFEATFPMRKYPYSREIFPFKDYFDILKDFMVNKKPFRFIVSRAPKIATVTPKKARSLTAQAVSYNAANTIVTKGDYIQTALGSKWSPYTKGSIIDNINSIGKKASAKTAWSSAPQLTGTNYEDIRSGDSVVVNGYLGFWDTNLPVSLESMEIKENADDGDDVVVEFKLKQYKAYGVKFLKTKSTASTTSTKTTIKGSVSGKTSKESTSTASKARAETKDTNKDKTYTIVAGDTLTIIAKKFYDDANKWKVIYEKNKELIEKTAKDMGKPSSQGGNYIWAGVTLIIPALS